ncbi:hypothetical protein SAMN06265795_1166 [Noviherbaspirillum humi]|uniref:Response regulator receiver domain-containing protein n=1 Tax=Noviherbaspirillum humi TaxID=1688639 RepID=A0A239KI18_9BURK|nr:hypothetical protein [Noviherbaspirillum humi]SNT17821.1 hypothetical protein SAMN06265795_1166 [Noviherbaspirillum humi]
MEDRPDYRPWQPPPFAVAVLDSDETLADSLCQALRDQGFAATAFYDIDVLAQAISESRFDAYVLDYLADWQPNSPRLEEIVAAILAGTPDAPVFVLGNQTRPENVEPLAGILMRHRVRYLVRPLATPYLVKRIGEAIAKRAGL